MKYKLFLCFLIVVFVPACSRSNEGTTNIPLENEYILNVGSDTMVNMALAWAEAYHQEHPEILLSVTGGGSGTGIASLINGTIDIANASREMKQEEYDKARSNGLEPVEFTVAQDAIAVIVNPANPINKLTLQQVSDIFSGKIQNWEELGGEDRPIVRLSRETNSGTHVYFLEEVLRLGQAENKTLFSRDTLLLPSSEGITAEVRDNPNAIGYDGLGYITDDVKVLSLAGTEDASFIYPSSETVRDGTYPIARNLYMYTIGQPTDKIKNYLDWIFSPVAQDIVKKLGFVPVTLNQD